jgi:hypothetical protein
MSLSWFSEITVWAGSLDAKWELAKSDGKDFSAFAFSELQGHTFHEKFNLQNDVKEILVSKVFPIQANAHSNFGDPPLTLYMANDQSFYLDLYIWNESQTSTHQHAFEGAFTLLDGHSFESEYEFRRTEQLGPSFIGKQTKKSLLYLSPGDVRPIHLNHQTIHRVLHLSKPTVSLVLRNRMQKESEIQYNYDFNFLASNGHPPGEIIAKFRALTWFLKDGNTPDYKMIESLIPYAQIWLLLATYPKAFIFFKKLYILYPYNIHEKMNEQILFMEIFQQLKTEENRILFTVYEFYRENWISRLDSDFSFNIPDPAQKLCEVIKSLPTMNAQKLNSPLLCQLFMKELATEPI